MVKWCGSETSVINERSSETMPKQVSTAARERSAWMLFAVDGFVIVDHQRKMTSYRVGV